MTITLSKKIITEIITAANAIIPRKCSLPVLEHLFISVRDEEHAEITATDLEQTLVMNIKPQAADEPFEFLIQIDEFKNLKKTMKKGDTLTIEPCGDDELTLTTNTAAGELSWMVGTMTTDEFPMTQEVENLVEYDVGTFLDAYRCAAVCASTDVSRGALVGVYADPKEHVLVGTDGRRLTKKPLNDFPFETDIILPVTKALEKRLKPTGTGFLGVKEDGHETIFELRTEKCRYVCKGVVGTYPNYKQVIPGDLKDFNTTLSFSDADLVTLDALAPHIKDDSNNTMFLRGNGNRVAAGIESEENGPCAMALPGCRFEGKGAVDVTINCKLLQDAVKNGFLNMQIQDRFTPLYFTQEDGAMHLIMPLRTEPADGLGAEFDVIVGKVPDAEPETTEPDEASEPIPASKPEKAEAPKPEPKEENENMPNPETQKQQPEGKDLKVVESQDPVARLEELAAESQEAVKIAQTSVKELKKQARAVKS